MDTDKKIFLTLVPHQDTRQELRKHSDLLLNTGITGIYPFPLAAPLAVLSKPLNPDELKQIAHGIRANIGTGKITAKETSAVTIPTGKEDMTLFGLKLDLDLSEIFKINNQIIPSVIGYFLVPKTNEQQLCAFASLRDAHFQYNELSFRAAAIANMSWQPIQDSFKYKIGKLCWLPRVIKP